MRAHQNPEKFKKLTFENKNNFFEAFEEFPTKFLIFILWILMILGFRKLESWKTAIGKSRSRPHKKAGGRFFPSQVAKNHQKRAQSTYLDEYLAVKKNHAEKLFFDFFDHFERTSQKWLVFIEIRYFGGPDFDFALICL